MKMYPSNKAKQIQKVQEQKYVQRSSNMTTTTKINTIEEVLIDAHVKAISTQSVGGGEGVVVVVERGGDNENKTKLI